MRQRKTDYGTIILHWTFVAAFAVALVTGLRIATETPDRTWINWFDAVLPRDSVWVAHMQAAIVLVAVAIGYVVYMLRSGLGRRVQLDKVRLRGLFGRGQARLSAMIALMYWIFFVTMSGLLVSGGLLYFGFYSGYDVAMLHWVGTWVILAFVVLHVLTQYKSGGVAQLLRIFRPAPLPAPPPRLDAVELLGMLAEQSARAAESENFGAPPEVPSHPLQPRAEARRDRTREPDPAPRPGRPRAIAKPDPAGQCIRGRGRRRDHRRLAPRGNRSALGRQLCRFAASIPPTHRSSTATLPIGPGAASSRSRS